MSQTAEYQIRLCTRARTWLASCSQASTLRCGALQAGADHTPTVPGRTCAHLACLLQVSQRWSFNDERKQVQGHALAGSSKTGGVCSSGVPRRHLCALCVRGGWVCHVGVNMSAHTCICFVSLNCERMFGRQKNLHL